ncbi:hypothetical protein KEP88_16825 [Escherichia coli]|nr:hypothetical protein [Escherichia coli]
MTKINVFLSVFFIILLSISNSKNAYADPGDGGAVQGNKSLKVNVTPAGNWQKVGTIEFSQSTVENLLCNFGAQSFCSWHEAGKLIWGEAVGLAYHMKYRIANVKATGDTGNAYDIKIALVSAGTSRLHWGIHYSYKQGFPWAGLHVDDKSPQSKTITSPTSINNYVNNVYQPDGATDGNNNYWKLDAHCGKEAGCYWGISMIHTGKYDVWAYLPTGINESELSFTNADLIEMALMTDQYGLQTWGNGASSHLYLSGKLTFPSSCSFTLSKSEINFGNVEAQYEPGELGSQSIDLITKCTYTNPNLKLAYTVSTTQLTENDSMVSVLEYASDNKSKALGLIFGFDGENISCGGNSRKYNWEYIFNNKQTSSNTKLDFKLCQYDLPRTYGEKSATLNVIVKWLAPN